VLSVIGADKCADVMEGERSSLVQENYVTALKEGSESGLQPMEEGSGDGLIETGA